MYGEESNIKQGKGHIMIDYNLKPYQWHQSMDVVMKNINLKNIEIKHNESISLEFLNSYNGAFANNLLCQNVWKTEMDFDGVMKCEFPVFIVEVMVKKLENEDIRNTFEYFNFSFEIPSAAQYNLLCIISGEICIYVICENVVIS